MGKRKSLRPSLRAATIEPPLRPLQWMYQIVLVQKTALEAHLVYPVFSRNRASLLLRNRLRQASN